MFEAVAFGALVGTVVFVAYWIGTKVGSRFGALD